MQKKDQFAISAKDYALSILVNSTTPMVLEIQLMWFNQEITNYMIKELFFQASNGIVVGYNSEFSFTYTPSKMEPQRGYLLGFGSNKSGKSYNKATIHCKSEEEKFRLANDISLAIHELIQEAIPTKQPSSPWLVWNIDKAVSRGCNPED